MKFFEYFFKTIPAMMLPDIIIHVVAMLGAILISYGVFLETEKRQDAVFLIGGLALFVYALWLSSPVFMVATGLFTLASGYEFVRIVAGKHVHKKLS